MNIKLIVDRGPHKRAKPFFNTLGPRRQIVRLMFWGVFGYGGSCSRHRPARFGSLIFHFASPWYFTPLASNWSTIDFTVDVTFWVCGVVFVAVNLFTAYCVWRFRARPGNKAHYEPESTKLEIILTVFTTVGVAAMLTPGLFVWADFVQYPKDATPPKPSAGSGIGASGCRARTTSSARATFGI